MSSRIFLIAFCALIMSGCLAGDLDLTESNTSQTVAELSDADFEESMSSEEFAEESADELQCNPGPSSNWCQNVEGTSCSSSTFRRCFIPGYCEWAACTCNNGVWGPCQ
ncbi:hypothetical protein [Haliangium ochraceum]|uniref:Lipoprotein n=1 Tax=Haliangium ochraceum (strain DSM 14365 / JCM 11303 / SMP-2) TaxID=502025 RepID=D0LTK1_HALO1|nr:hypothetical protein [Haliangium ochraceum]ACY13896.1 hypothetical protein Hoch_1340 [Haliangium ochraceum DSM 14365]